MSSLTINLDNIADDVIKVYQEDKKTYKKKIISFLSTETRRSYPNFIISDKTKKSAKLQRVNEVFREPLGKIDAGFSLSYF